jgi:hypothetical protein
VSLARILNFTSYVLVALIQVLTGFAIEMVSRLYAPVFARGLPGQPLPGLTLFMLEYGNSFAATIGVLTALGFLGILLFLDLSKRTKYLIPCAVVAITMAWFEILAGLITMVLPLVRIIS